MILSTTWEPDTEALPALTRESFGINFVLAKNKVERSWFKQCALGDNSVPGSGHQLCQMDHSGRSEGRGGKNGDWG